jgi:hypothetical protein
VPNRSAKTDAGSQFALIAARPDRGAHLRRGRRLRVKVDQHGSTPLRLAGKQANGLFRVPPHSLRTVLAIKKA